VALLEERDAYELMRSNKVIKELLNVVSQTFPVTIVTVDKT